MDMPYKTTVDDVPYCITLYEQSRDLIAVTWNVGSAEFSTKVTLRFTPEAIYISESPPTLPLQTETRINKARTGFSVAYENPNVTMEDGDAHHHGDHYRTGAALVAGEPIAAQYVTSALAAIEALRDKLPLNHTQDSMLEAWHSSFTERGVAMNG